MEKVKKILKFIACVTAFTAIYNKIVAILATSLNILKTSEGEYFLWDYGKVYYEKKGEGSPVILLHDLTSASSAYEWSKISDELSKQHTVYIPDLLGCGRSDKPGTSYSNFLYVKFLSSFLKEVVGEPCTVISSGNSSSFSLLAGRFNSELIKEVICINPANPYGYDQSKSIKEKFTDVALSVPIFGTTLYNHYLSQDKIKKLFAEKYFYKENSDIKNHVQAYHEAAHRKLRFARNFLAAEKLNYCVLPVKHILSDIKFDIKLIFGAEEENSSDIAEMYKEYNGNISIEFIPEAKHLPQLEKAEEVLKLL